MKFSLDHLRKLAHLSKNIKDNVILDAINNLGFEINEVKEFSNLKKILIGKIISIKKHPNANRLFVLEVSIGAKNLQIITSATNIVKNKQVIVFMIGAIYNGKVLKKANIRGIESEGMLASLFELTTNFKNIKILNNEVEILDTNYKLGANALDVLDLKDKIVDIDILSNRADTRCYMILALQLSAYFSTNMKPMMNKTMSSFKTKLKIKKGYENHISLLEAKLLKGKTSFKDRLLLIKTGFTPVNPIVDLANLVLILFGQTISVYDKSKVGTIFNVKKYSGKVLAANNKNVLLKDNLTIFSDNKPIAIAGLIGLESTKVTDETKNVVFIAANYKPSDIRDSIKTTNITTNNSNRNINKISLSMINLAMNYLQKSLDSSSNILNPYKSKFTTIKVNNEVINDYAGFEITKSSKYKKALSILQRAGYEINNDLFTIPFYRCDIENEYDIIEDIFIAFGYNNFPEIEPNSSNTFYSNKKCLKQMFVSQNYNEVITYSLRDNEYNMFNPFKISKNISILSSLSVNKKYYRKNIINSLVEVALLNNKKKINNFSLFEIGYLNANFKYENVALLSTLKDFYTMKNDVVRILQPYGNIKFVRTLNQQLHPGVSADIFLNNKYYGFIGKFNPLYKNVDYQICEFKVPKNNVSQKFIEFSNQQLSIRELTINLKKNKDVGEHISKLKKIISIFHIEYKTEFLKENNLRAITFKLYLDINEAKKFDQKYN